MCYSGLCKFENYMGDCTVGNYKEFQKKYGECPCDVGGFPTDEETDIYIDENKERLEAIYHQWFEDSSYRGIRL